MFLLKVSQLYIMSAYNEVTPSKKTAANFGTTEVLYVGQIDPTLLLKMLDEVQVLKNLRAEMLILKVYQINIVLKFMYIKDL